MHIHTYILRTCVYTRTYYAYTYVRTYVCIRVQGPFKYPEEVLRLKYKPLQPTLRVATDFKSVEAARAELKAEEWRQRVIDEKCVEIYVQYK